MKRFINFFTRKKEIYLLILVLLISLFPRLWHLTDFPPIVVDEAANLRDINELLSYSVFRPLDYEWGYGQATLVHYPTIFLISLGVKQFLALRLTSVILSLLALIPFFFIVKKYSDTIIAFCTTLMFSFSYYYLQFSRVGWTNIHPILLGIFLIYLIDLAIEKKSYFILLFSGLIAGLLTYTYRSGEIYILAGFFLLISKLLKQKSLQQKIKAFGTFLLAFSIISLPWILKIFGNWELYNLRTRVVYVFDTGLPYHSLYKQNEILIYQIISTIKSWILFLPSNGGGIENLRYLPLNHAPVSPIIAGFFLLGLIVAFYRFKATYIWLIIYFLGLLFGQILTVDPPNGSRGLILLPIIYIFSALTLNLIFNRFRKNKLIIPFLVIISAIISYMDFLFYQNWMSWIKV